MSRNIDLMPRSYRQRVAQVGLRQRLALVAGALAMIVVVLSVHARSGVARQRAVVSDLTVQVAALDDLRAEAMRISRRGDMLSARLEEYHALALPIDLSRILMALSEMMPPSLVLTDLTMRVVQRQVALSPMEKLREQVRGQGSGSRSEQRRTVRILEGELSGWGVHGMDVAQFIERLERHPLFGRAQLEYDRTGLVRQVHLREFRIRFEIDLEPRYVVSHGGER